VYRQDGDLAVSPARNTLTCDDRPPVLGQGGDVRVPLPPGRSNFPIRNMSPESTDATLYGPHLPKVSATPGWVRMPDLANVQCHILTAGLDAMVWERGGMKVWATQNRPDLVAALPPAEASRQAGRRSRTDGVA
jgi:hypothetical protein